MRTIAIAVLVLIAVFCFAKFAFAGWTGSKVGNFSYWNNTSTGQQVTCSQVGEYTYCN